MMPLLQRARVLAPMFAGLLLASCAGVRTEPYVVQEPGYLAPVEYQQKAVVIAPRIYREYNPHTFPIVGTDIVTTRTTIRSVNTVLVSMERPEIPACKCHPKVPRTGITFEFEPSGELIYTTHTTGSDRAIFKREEFAWWPSSRRLYGTRYKD
ncbi:MAG TPA: hypothetical protein VLE43_10570 [Candidatus Saccharimonadia bacterium]|nr:hypothetical protein [Candidatus Saccharimonadia bacterium]